MDLASQLQELRARAGSPSYRTLENLIGRQGRQRRMARATIQEKISGKSSLTLPQALAIVEALAEYARSKDIALPPGEIDREIWRNRVGDASKQQGERPKIKQADAKRTSAVDWNIEPLKQAQMDDLIHLISSHKSDPVAEWLPRILREMLTAGMSVTDFLDKAAQDSPQGIVSTLQALEGEFPYTHDSDPWAPAKTENEQTVGELVRFAARNHGSTSTSALIVSLRRAGLGRYCSDFIAAISTWHRASSLAQAVDILRHSTLENDAEDLLKSIGGLRRTDRIAEVVRHFEQKDQEESAKKILQAIGERHRYQLKTAVQDFEKRNAPDSTMLHIARGIPRDKLQDYVKIFADDWKMDRFAALIMQVYDEPPF